MKKILLLLSVLLCCVAAFGAGIMVTDAVAGNYLRLTDLSLNVQIMNQVAITSLSARFVNDSADSTQTNYAFPMHEEASATSLSWLINGTWHDAVIASGAAGPINPEGTVMDPYIDAYMGKSPLIFPFTEYLAAGDTITIQMEYVELLKYHDGEVSYSFPLHYGYLSNPALNSLTLNMLIGGGRNVTAATLDGFPGAVINLLDGQAEITLNQENVALNTNLDLTYTLEMENLGAITFSSFVQDDYVPDDLGNGFFLCVIEPEPGVDVIQKYFTFVMDCSSQMSGSSIEQAKTAAAYMVENLNPGDYFNVVNFRTVANTFALTHVPYTPENRDLALSYIDNLGAEGMCSISGAFDTAIPQFNLAPPNVANIVVFLSKGTPSVGIVETDELVNHVNSLVNATGRLLNIFCFGVGNDVNPALLSQIASDNGGSATWVGISDFSEVLIDFYAKIRNPVLLNPSITFETSMGPVSELYPVQVPNLYLGTQMLLCGRYPIETANIDFTVEGSALGSIMSYQYKSDLSSMAIDQYRFLMKIWAKMKIEHLMNLYDQMDPESQEAIDLRQDIIDISVSYGVLCKFTSFNDDGDDPNDPPIEIQEDIMPELSPRLFVLRGNYPNPFNPSTTISFEQSSTKTLNYVLKIYNCRGQLVKTLRRDNLTAGLHHFQWDGMDEQGHELSSGVYFYTIHCGNERQAGKMLMLR